MVREFMAENDISPTDMIAQLQVSKTIRRLRNFPVRSLTCSLAHLLTPYAVCKALGWSGKEWELGVKTEIEYSDLQKRIQTIPGMLKNAGIRSRVTAGLSTPAIPASGGGGEGDKTSSANAPELKK